MAAYGDYGPAYIGTTVAYSEGGYETEPRSSNVAPEVEPVLMDAMERLLDVRKCQWDLASRVALFASIVSLDASGVSGVDISQLVRSQVFTDLDGAQGPPGGGCCLLIRFDRPPSPIAQANDPLALSIEDSAHCRSLQVGRTIQSIVQPRR